MSHFLCFPTQHKTNSTNPQIIQILIAGLPVCHVFTVNIQDTKLTHRVIPTFNTNCLFIPLENFLLVGHKHGYTILKTMEKHRIGLS